jgi:putative tryptophan/tyrosine transport system substrate-binding protein
MGYAEGRNIAIEYRWGNGDVGRLPALAAELVQHQAAVIAATGGDPVALAAKRATRTLPIVCLAAVGKMRRSEGQLRRVATRPIICWQ